MVVVELLDVGLTVIGLIVVTGRFILKGHFALFPALSVTLISTSLKQQEPIYFTMVAL